MEPSYLWSKKYMNQRSGTAFLLISKHPKIWFILKFNGKLLWHLVQLHSLHKVSYTLVLFVCYRFNKILDRYIISYKIFAVPNEKDLFCWLSVKTCHRPSYNKAVIMAFWCFSEKFCRICPLTVRFLIILIKS